MAGDYIIGIDIGGTKVSGCLCGRDGVLARVRQPTRLAGNEDAIPGQVCHIVDHLRQSAGIRWTEILALGVSTAGPFGLSEGMRTLISPNLCGGLPGNEGRLSNGWTRVPLEREIKKRFGTYQINNDAVCGAVAERTFGAGTGMNDILYVTWSTGIGTGAYVDGLLLSGKNGNAPHGGHIYLVEDGPLCGCGNRGDLESLSSGTAIARRYGGGGGVSTAEVFERYGKKEERAVEVIKNAAMHFGRGLASINAVLDTALIIIGGSVFLNNQEILLPLVCEEFYRSFSVLSEGVRIIPSGLGEYLGEMGGLSLVMPEDWVEEWRTERRWEGGPEMELIE